MIVIDGNAAEYNVNTFSNLEELLVKVMEDELENRIVTDVIVDEAQFVEEFPHQAGQVETSSFDRVEIKSMSVNQFALGIIKELDKVIALMQDSSLHIAGMFRDGDKGEALALFTEMLNVLHDFMGMLGVLRQEFAIENDSLFETTVEDVSSQFEKMGDATAKEDWSALAAILEKDFSPAVARWKSVVVNFREIVVTTDEG